MGLPPDPRERVTSFAFDSFGRLVAMTESQDGVTTCDYDGDRQVIRMSDSEGRVIEFRDPRGQCVTRREDSDTGRITFTSEPLRAGACVTYTYEVKSRSTTDPGERS